MGKTVLILGNGFDLAHGLPTRYSDFLNFCNIIYRIKDSIKHNEEYTWEEYENIMSEIKKHKTFSELLEKYYKIFLRKEKSFPKYGNSNSEELLDIDFETINTSIDKVYNLIKDNIWYSYFTSLYRANNIKGNNWIDFESEISFVIETIDKHLGNLLYNWYYLKTAIDDDDIDFPNKLNIFRTIVDNIFNKRFETVKNVRKRMYDDLNDIISALEIYLSEFVEKLIKPNKLDLIDQIEPDCIINFNYTHTYQNVYGDCEDVFHIHGELNHEPNNMVLGIDEYWSKKERDIHTNFTIFKKFAQRIQKEVGIENYNWFDEILYDYKKRSDFANVYIFGHSLDVTDKDILRDYLKSAATIVTIYCIDNETEGEYIANLIKIMGEKRLLEKINQYPKKLKFVILDKNNSTEEKEKNEKELLTSGAAP